MKEDAFIVKGGTKLTGDVFLSGSKNVALKAEIAALMVDGPVLLCNIPHIKDIEELLHLLKDLGVTHEFMDKNTLKIDASNLHNDTVDLLYASKIRVSFMLFAPLLYRLKKAHIPNPGGCRIGARSIDRTIDVLKSFGVDVEYISKTGYYDSSLENSYRATEYRFEKKTHTGTELAILLGVCAQGRSVIENAAEEPEINTVIEFLNKCGGKITRARNSIIIDGVSKLVPPNKKFEITFDRNEAVTYAVFALATKGDVKIYGASPRELGNFIEKVREAGGGIDEEKKYIRFYFKKQLAQTHIVTSAHPGFMTDWQAPWAVLMTQARGVSTIHETVFENRFGYVAQLAKMGAQIVYKKPIVEDPVKTYQFNITKRNWIDTRQQIEITGNVPLHNAALKVSDMRAGASLIVAALIARGESVIVGASTIDRGYEDIVGKLTRLGAKIKRV